MAARDLLLYARQRALPHAMMMQPPHLQQTKATLPGVERRSRTMIAACRFGKTGRT